MKHNPRRAARLPGWRPAVYLVVRVVDYPDSHMVGSDSLHSPTSIAERPRYARKGVGSAVADLLRPVLYTARQRRQFARRSADIGYRLGQERSRPVVVFEMCNNSLSSLRCPRHNGTSRRRRRQAQRLLRCCDTVQVRPPNGGIAASEPSASHIGAQKIQGRAATELVSQTSWQVQLIVIWNSTTKCT